MVERVLSSRGVRRVAMRLEEGAKRIHDEAQAAWPVDSGRSKEALEYGIRLGTSTSLESFVRNTSSYWMFIRKPWPENNRYVYRELILKPGRREAKRIAKAMKHELRKLAGGT